MNEISIKEILSANRLDLALISKYPSTIKTKTIVFN